jgi:hypothetical protein
MAKKQKNLTEAHENIIAQNLIDWHTIGSVRDASDFNTIKYHIQRTIEFTRTILLDYKGSQKKAEHLLKVIDDLEKFKVK